MRAYKEHLAGPEKKHLEICARKGRSSRQSRIKINFYIELVKRSKDSQKIVRGKNPSTRRRAIKSNGIQVAWRMRCLRRREKAKADVAPKKGRGEGVAGNAVD